MSAGHIFLFGKENRRKPLKRILKLLRKKVRCFSKGEMRNEVLRRLKLVEGLKV